MSADWLRATERLKKEYEEQKFVEKIENKNLNNNDNT